MLEIFKIATNLEYWLFSYTFVRQTPLEILTRYTNNLEYTNIWLFEEN